MWHCNFDCDCPVDNVFEEGFRAGLGAAIRYIEDQDIIQCAPCRHPNGKYPSGGYCYCELFADEEITKNKLLEGIRAIEVPND